jgi:hypothetical protein
VGRNNYLAFKRTPCALEEFELSFIVSTVVGFSLIPTVHERYEIGYDDHALL